VTAVDATSAVREAEVRALALLEGELPDVLDRLVRVAAQVTGASGARINIVTGRAQHTIASAVGPAPPLPVEASMCARILGDPATHHLVPDARQDPRFAEVPMVVDGAVRTYDASPLVTTHDVPIGTLCVYDADTVAISDAALAVLDELAGAVMAVLEQGRAHEAVRASLAELAVGTQELRRSNENLAAFAGQVSHDVQGPLAAVLMALQLMDELDQDDERQDRLRRRALSGAQRMRSTISALLDYAVLGGSLSREPLDMNTLVAEVLVDLRARIGEGTVVVEDLPTMWGDDVQVRAVTQNLVANALKYAGAAPRVRVHAESADGITRLVVSDNGPGVPPADRAAIFELHVRGRTHASSGVEGLGIGLATCRRVLDAHGGRIGVEDSAEGGAAFWFELPDQPA
jgi:signal transduction histidine kinase